MNVGKTKANLFGICFVLYGAFSLQVKSQNFSTGLQRVQREIQLLDWCG